MQERPDIGNAVIHCGVLKLYTSHKGQQQNEGVMREKNQKYNKNVVDI